MLKEDYLKSMLLKSFRFLNDSVAIVCYIVASSFPQIFVVQEFKCQTAYATAHVFIVHVECKHLRKLSITAVSALC